MKKELVPELRFPEFLEAGEWDSTTFGAAATFINGKAYKQEELLEQGKYRVLRVGNFFTNKEWYFSDLELEEDKYCDKGDLLYAWSASFGPRIWTGKKVIYHYHIWKVVEAKGIDKQFLFVLLDYETERMKSESANGLGLLHITKGAIESWECCIPREKEQQKIADCLSSIDKLVTAQTQKLDALKVHKKGLMQQLFPAEGETAPKLRFPEFRDAGEWIRRTGDEITIKITKGSSPNWQGFSYQSQGVLFITSENVRDGFLDVSNPKYLPEEFYEKQQNSQLSYGDILINIVGASIGRSCLYLLDNKAFTNQAVALFRVNRITSFKFISYYYQNDEIQREMFGTQSESARPNLSLTDLKDMEFYLPSFIEQQKIADCLSSLDELITAQTQKINTLKAHKKGLMQQLFPAVDEVGA